MRNLPTQAGFTAVELMITLFIGAAFIGSGYQLYGIAIKDGADARVRTQASSLAYSQLRTSAAAVTNPCTTKSPVTIPVATSEGLGVTQMTVTVGCPYGASSSVSAVTVSLPYGNDSPKQKVTHALYVTAQ